MKPFPKILAAAALAGIALTQPARADLTADDVWHNVEAYIDALGAQRSVKTERQGKTLSVGRISLSWTLPLGAGTLSVEAPGPDLTENDDGTVAVSFHQPLRYEVSAALKDAGTFSGTLVATADDLETTASGIPDDVTYETAAESVDLKFDVAENSGSSTPPIEFTMRMENLSGSTRIAVGSLVETSSQYAIGKQDYSAGIGGSDGLMELTGSADTTETRSALSIPRYGTEIMKLGTALKKGLAFSAESSITGYRSHQKTTAKGELVSDQVDTFAQYQTSLTLDRDHLLIDVSQLDGATTLQMPSLLPLPIAFSMKTASGRLDLPVSASEEPQKLSLHLDGTEIEVSDDLWNLLDPRGVLPHEPAEVRFTMSGTVTNSLDWLDFETLSQKISAGVSPAEIRSLSLDELSYSMLGANLQGSGAFTFDNSDRHTFDGIPRPEGRLSVILTGANALFDDLVEAGILSQEDATGARMGLGMFAKPVPGSDDVMKSDIEITPDGHVLSNGMRIK